MLRSLNARCRLKNFRDHQVVHNRFIRQSHRDALRSSVGLLVPDESASGPHSVSLYRLSA